MKLIEKINKLGILQTIDDLSGNFFSYLKYIWCLITKQVYFGAYLAAKQGQPIRHYYMQKLVNNHCNKINDKIKILGNRFRAGGSAITWAEAVKKYCKHEGIVLCIDHWNNYLDSLDSKLMRNPQNDEESTKKQ